jgi:hypothetical protein
MTATAPASSATLACSTFMTSMMTPPFNIWARPDLTPKVPVWEDLWVVEGSDRTGRGMEADCELALPLVEGVEAPLLVPLTVVPLGSERLPSLS